MTRGTGNGSMYSLSCNRKPCQDYLHSSTHPPHYLKFICIFKPDESIPLLHKMFLSDPLSSDPAICAWVSQLVSSLFVLWLKCYMPVLSLWCELQALCIQLSIISSSVNYLVKSKYKLLVIQTDKICTHIHTHTHTHTQIHTHIQPSQVLMTRKESCRGRWLPFTKICVA